MSSRPRSRFLRYLGALTAIALALLCANVLGLSSAMDAYLSDLRFRAKQRPPTGEIVLVDIDGKSLHDVGVWPWPRSLYGELVAKATELGARRIAFDIDFSSASSPDQDTAFAAALAETDAETFLAAFVQPSSTGSATMLPSLPIDTLLRHSWPVTVNVPVDGDGMVRRFPFEIRTDTETLESMPAVLSNRSAEEGTFGIDFSISTAELPRVSFTDVINGRVGADTIAGKTLIVGATAIELNDRFRVPVHGIVSGSTVIALATETLLQGRELAFRQVPPILLLGIGFAAFLLLFYRKSLLVVLPVVGCALAIEALAFYLQLHGNVVLRTASVQLLIGGLLLWAFLREFDLRRLRLWLARTEIKNGRSMLERVVEDGFDGVVIIDQDDRVTRMNGLASELLDLGSVAGLEDLPADLVEEVRKKRRALMSGEHVAREQHALELSAKGSERRILEYMVAPFWLQTVSEQSDAADVVYVCISIRDVTKREVAQDELRQMALHDSLTGLYTRQALEQKLQEVSTGAVVADGLALVAFNLDRFNAVNDALSHSVGDKVLVEVARRARAVFGEHALIARAGGDSFFAVYKAGSPEEAEAPATGFLAAMEEPIAVRHHRIAVRVTIGINWWRVAKKSPAAAMREADIALHQAKNDGARLVLFNAAMERGRLERLELERDLARALDENEIEVVYQPQIALRNDVVVGAEALMRWRHPTKGDIPPSRFIPVAEETGLIHRLGAFVLTQACCDAAAWPVPIKVAVNVSSLQFETGDLQASVRAALRESELPPERLELEITESTFVKENERLREIFAQLISLGVHFALDDFGTGYSSLSYLQRFPVSKIKIDRSFIAGIPDDDNAMAILRSVKALGDGLGIRTIAEGVETARQVETLYLMGFDEAQGFLYARPLRNEALVRTMGAHRAKAVA